MLHFLDSSQPILQYYRVVSRKNLYALLFTVAAICVISACRRGSEPVRIGDAAPDFSLTDSDRTVRLSQFRGKPILLNFWATWCPPCVEEVPALVALQKQMGDKVVILAVSADEDEEAYKKFTQKHMPGLLTIRDGKQQSNRLYGTFAFPETYVIDREGVIRRKFIGAVDWTSPEIIDYLNKM